MHPHPTVTNFLKALRITRQRRGIAALAEIDSTKCCPKGERSESMRRQRCRGLPASATPLSRAVGRPNVLWSLDSGVVGAKGLRLAPLPPHSTTLSRLLLSPLLMFVLSLFTSCTGTNSSSRLTETFRWEGHQFDKAVGYLFSDLQKKSTLVLSPPSEEAGMLDFDSTNYKASARNESPIIKTVDFECLVRYERKSVVLNVAQTKQLLLALQNPWNHVSPQANCYNPHHIFVFYRGSEVVGAVEICFMCGNTRSTAEKYQAPSFPRLRELCHEIGLGTKAPWTIRRLFQF
jgi:hypothetical protein